jgi:uracil-DNA glycosylase
MAIHLLSPMSQVHFNFQNLVEGEWRNLLNQEIHKEYFTKITHFLSTELDKGNVIYPAQENIFNAFALCDFEKTKVVILGQDPYHGENQANGLSFSVPDTVKIPPSLMNIFKEIDASVGSRKVESGNLEPWAKQGVLLLNSVLTVRKDEAASHRKIGWQQFTDKTIQLISDKLENVVFILWGSFAHKKEILIDSKKHLILKSAHPSPLSSYRGFFGGNHFILANNYLQTHGKQGITW